MFQATAGPSPKRKMTRDIGRSAEGRFGAGFQLFTVVEYAIWASSAKVASLLVLLGSTQPNPQDWVPAKWHPSVGVN